MGKRGRGEPKTSARLVASKARQVEYFNLRAAGFTLLEIGERFGVSAQAVEQAISKRMEELPSEAADRYRQLISQRLEKTIRLVEPMMKRGSAGDRLQAVGRYVKANMELARLHNCTVEVSMPITGPVSIAQTNIEQKIVKIDLTQMSEEQLGKYSQFLAEFAQHAKVERAPEDGAHGGNGHAGNGKPE